MSYVRGLIHGTVIGAAVGICIAPQQGSRTRTQLRGAWQLARANAGRAQETARHVAPVVQQAARSMGAVASVVDKLRHRDETEPVAAGAPSYNGDWPG